MAFHSDADEISETINIEIDILWNSTSLNAGAQAPVINTEIPPSILPNAASEGATTAVASSGSSSHIGSTSSITNSSEVGLLVETQINPFTSIGSSWPSYCDLTGSAPAASQSSGMNQFNNSLWATSSLQPTMQASLSPFSGRASASKESGGDIGLLIVLSVVLGIFL